MTRRALLAGVGLLGFCFTVATQASDRSGQAGSFALQQPIGFPTGLGGMDSTLRSFPALALSDESRFSFSTGFSSIANPPPHFLPSLATARPQRSNATAASNSDSLERLELSRPSSVYVSGEIGFLYGISSGKHGGDFSQEYIVGEVGDEHFHIRVGASHEESNVRRFGR